VQNCLARTANRYVRKPLRKQGSPDTARAACTGKRYARDGLTGRGLAVSDAGRSGGLRSSTIMASEPDAEVQTDKSVRTGYG